MASHTPNLDLLKKDPVTDGNDTFNIETMLNENWDKIDAAVGQLEEEMQEIDIPLSDETNGTRSNVAGSEKAVGLVMQAANAANLAAGAVRTEVDTHVNLTTAHGAVSTATANRMIVRDASGRAKVAAPSASDDIAIKSTVDNAVGTLSTLKTTAKTNAVAAINELFQSASDGKTAVAAAITGKGVPASGSDTFAQLAGKIEQISTGIKVASGNFSPAVTPNAPSGSIANLPFSPKLLILFGYVERYSMRGPIDIYAYGNLVAYNINGTLIIGDSIRADLREPSYGYVASANIDTVNFGSSELSFTLRFSQSSDYLINGAITKYIVFGV